MKIKIDKNIAIPSSSKNTKGYADAMREMQIGDSFSVVGDKPRLRSAFFAAARYTKIKIVTRQERNGLRVWKVESK
jgi:TusA-related sulfurtransferase